MVMNLSMCWRRILLMVALVCVAGLLSQAAAVGQAPRGVYLYSWDIANDYDAPKAVCASNCSDEKLLYNALAVNGVDGLTLVMDWSTIETSPNGFAWGRMDGWIQAAASFGKNVNLAIRGGGGATGGATPCWLFHAGCLPGYTGGYTDATALTFNAAAHQGALNNCVTERIAAPWDPVFKTQWENMLTKLATHLQTKMMPSTRPEWDAVSMIRLTGINRTTDEFRLPEQTPTTLASCGANPVNAIQVWLTPPSKALAPYTPDQLSTAWTSLADFYNITFPGKYFNLPIIPNGTGTGLSTGQPQNPFPEIDNSGCVFDPPVDPTQISPQPCPDPNFAGVDQNATLLNIASQTFSDRLTIEFESLNTQNPANPYVVQQVQMLNGGDTTAAFQTNDWLGGQSPSGGAVCVGGPGTGSACATWQDYFKLLKQGIYLPTATSNPQFRAQFLEVFYSDVLRSPTFECAIWKAHIDLTDYTAPVTIAKVNGTRVGGIYNAPVSVDFRATDASTSGQPVGCHPERITTEFRVNGGPWIQAKGLSLDQDGVYTIDYRSKDIAGNEEAIQSVFVAIVSKFVI